MSSDIVGNVHRALVSLNATYEIVEIDPDLADTAAFCEHYGYSLEVSANALLIASKRPVGHHAVCVALATTRLDVNHKVRDLLGVKKLSFASAEITADTTGMMIGGVTPFALPVDVPVFVDSRVMDLDRVIVGGGNRSTKILVDPEVFTRMASVTVVTDLANLPPLAGGS